MDCANIYLERTHNLCYISVYACIDEIKPDTTAGGFPAKRRATAPSWLSRCPPTSYRHGYGHMDEITPTHLAQTTTQARVVLSRLVLIHDLATCNQKLRHKITPNTPLGDVTHLRRPSRFPPSGGQSGTGSAQF